MKCLGEQQILDLQLGDATTSAERDHVQRCEACTARARALDRDLGRLGAVLGQAPPAARVHPRRVRWAPLAAAAVLVLAVAVQRYTTVGAPAADDTETLALLDELSSAMQADERAAATTSDSPSTCTWGEPLLGAGCDEPGLTVLAWH
ncbi:MAG: hypothetical protein ACREQL_15880 [Candidatus Binatia bacterium]